MKTYLSSKKIALPLLFLLVIVSLAFVLPGDSILFVLVAAGFLLFGWFIYRILTGLKGKRTKSNFIEAKKEWESISVTVPEFLTGKEREEFIRTKREEEIEKIDTSRDRGYKITFFQSWKKEREKKGNPLTPLEESFYGGLKKKAEEYNVWVVILPLAVLIALQKSGLPLTTAFVVSFGLGVFIKIGIGFFEKRK